MQKNNIKSKRIIFLLSHPIQYFSPLFVEIAKQPDFDLLVLYCSDENVKGHIDKEFGVEVKWDISLLDGYNYKFLKNNSWEPSIFNGFLGLINFETFKELKHERGNYLVIHGWAYFTNFIAILAAKLNGVKLCLRAENPLKHELLKPKYYLLLRKILFKYFIFRLFDYFLYIGEQNRKLYEYYGVKKEKLIFTPYAVDNDRFRNEYEKYRNKKTELRNELGLPESKTIILFSGKFIHKKRPVDILKAYHYLNNDNATLVFLGDGELRKEMEEYIKSNNIKEVYLMGFKNQSEIGKYFAAADIFVLPSGIGETWGLVVNEAMNFALPIIVSDIAGCAEDLVKDGINGYKFKSGVIEDIKAKLNFFMDNENLRESNGKKSLEIINSYSNKRIIDALAAIQ